MNNNNSRLEFSSRRPSSSSLSHFVFQHNSFPKRQRHTAAAGAATQHTLRRRRGRSPITALSASGLVAVAVSASSAVAFVVVGLVGVSIVSVVEGGVRGDLGASQEDILGIPAEDATAEDVARLGETIEEIQEKVALLFVGVWCVLGSSGVVGCTQRKIIPGLCVRRSSYYPHTTRSFC